MTAPLQDSDLLRAYVEKDSQGAFCALVSRHVDLVFSTAMRRVRNHQLAEEITQNVFVVLARKAPSLRGYKTLAGWLHHTTILEAKNVERVELRRRAREQRAAELEELETTGRDPVAACLPILDEALMDLRETDRMAIVARYFGNLSLRQVGEVLGVDEDAARKRVGRAVERLHTHLLKRGMAMPTKAALVALLSSGTQAAPAGVATTASQLALGSAGGGGFIINLLDLMTFSKAKTATACALLITAPIFWYSSHLPAMAIQDQALQSELEILQGQLFKLKEANAEAHGHLLKAASIRMGSELTAEQLRRKLITPNNHSVYQWDDKSSLVRVPKALLGKAELAATRNHRLELSEAIRELLQMTETEVEQVQGALNNFLYTMHNLQGAKMKQVEPTASEINGRSTEEVLAFEVPDLAPEFMENRELMFEQLKTVLGADRFTIFRGALADAIHIEDDLSISSLGSDLAVIERAHRVLFYKPQPGDQQLTLSISKELSRFSGALLFEHIPPHFHPYLETWMEEARREGQTLSHERKTE